MFSVNGKGLFSRVLIMWNGPQKVHLIEQTKYFEANVITIVEANRQMQFGCMKQVHVYVEKMTIFNEAQIKGKWLN